MRRTRRTTTPHPGNAYATALDPATTRIGSIGLRWFGVDAAADFLAIYAPDPL